MAKKKVLVVVGQTASGKSALGVRLAKKFGGQIISADSRQVYKGLDIGTGKITRTEMRGVPHHLLDIANPKRQFSASQYKEHGLKVLESVSRKKKLPIVVGGTGLYIDTLAGAVNFPDVPPDPKFRARMMKKSKEELFKMLKKKDPVRAQTIDPNNKLRLSRALEIVKALGKVPKSKPSSSPYEFIYVGIKPEKEELEKKIYQRLIKRLPAMIREAQRLHRQGLTWKRMHELGLEYRYLALYLQGKMTKDQMTDELFKEIKRYSRRQMTWFKRNKNIRWFKPDEYKKIEKYVRESSGR